MARWEQTLVRTPSTLFTSARIRGSTHHLQCASPSYRRTPRHFPTLAEKNMSPLLRKCHLDNSRGKLPCNAGLRMQYVCRRKKAWSRVDCRQCPPSRTELTHIGSYVRQAMTTLTSMYEQSAAVFPVSDLRCTKQYRQRQQGGESLTVSRSLIA